MFEKSDLEKEYQNKEIDDKELFGKLQIKEIKTNKVI